MNFISLIEQVLQEGVVMDVVNNLLKKDINLSKDTPRPKSAPTDPEDFPYPVVKNNRLAYIDLNPYKGIGFTAFIPKEYFNNTRKNDYIGVFAHDKFFNAFDTLVSKLEALPPLDNTDSEPSSPLKKRIQSTKLVLTDLTKNTPRPTDEELVEIEKKIKDGEPYLYVYNGVVASISFNEKRNVFVALRVRSKDTSSKARDLGRVKTLSGLFDIIENRISGVIRKGPVIKYKDILKRPPYQELKRIENEIRNGVPYRYIHNNISYRFTTSGTRNRNNIRALSNNSKNNPQSNSLPDLFDKIEDKASKNTSKIDRVSNFIRSLHTD